MHVFLNGRIVPEAEAVVSVFDRSFQLGDALFESIRISNSRPFRWAQHMDRLESGAAFLRIDAPFDRAYLRDHLQQLVAINNLPEAILRLHLSRGVGARGYSAAGANRPTLVMSLHASPDASKTKPLQWKVMTSKYPLQVSSHLTGFKTSSKLTQIVARAEANAAGADEAILLSPDGDVLESAAANILWIEGDKVCHVTENQGALAGVTQAVILEICAQEKIRTIERLAPVESVRNSGGCFLTLTSFGVVEIVEWDKQPTRRSNVTQRLFERYRERLKHECT